MLKFREIHVSILKKSMWQIREILVSLLTNAFYNFDKSNNLNKIQQCDWLSDKAMIALRSNKNEIKRSTGKIKVYGYKQYILPNPGTEATPGRCQKLCLVQRIPLQAGERTWTESQKPRQQCWPESFCKSGKFLRQVHYWLKNFWILCNTKYPDNMQSVRMNWKVSGQSKKCPDNLENVSG